MKKILKQIAGLCLKIYANNYNLHIDNYQLNSHEQKNRHYSQFGQDDYVLENIFNGRKNGIFVDVGANHPTNGSNTYLLELNGWSGIAIEPQDSLRTLWAESRTTPCLNYVIGPEEKDITFVESSDGKDGLSGVEGYNKCHDKANRITKRQRRLSDILEQNSVSKIDYLSIDVEGYEEKVLQSIDFIKTNITLISVENDTGFKFIPWVGKKLGSELGNNKIRKILTHLGYKYIARIGCDDFFIKND